MVAPTPLFIREPSLLKFGCSSSMMKTSYNDEYSMKKSGGIEIDCRPRYFQATLCKRFKGTTEYKREFSKCRNTEQEEEEALPTIQELQTLIIDL